MNEDFITTEEAQPTRDNRNIIIIAVVAVILLCCCCSMLYAAWTWGDLLLEYIGYY
jgi:hypothetical protein